MSENGHKIELPASIVIRELAQKIEKSPIDIIKKLMSNGVMASINQAVDFDTAAIVVAEYGFDAIPEVAVEEGEQEDVGEIPIWRQTIADEDEKKFLTKVTEIEDYLEGSQSRIGGLEKALQQVLPTLVENVRDLTGAVEGVKKEKEE